MTIFSALTHPGLFAPTATSAERLWYPDILARVWKDAGLYNIDISNTAPADTAKIWFDPDDGNAAPGQFKYWNGSAWVVMTATEFAKHIAARAGLAPPSTVTGGTSWDVDLGGNASGKAYVLATDITASGGSLFSPRYVDVQVSRNNGATWTTMEQINKGIVAGAERKTAFMNFFLPGTGGVIAIYEGSITDNDTVTQIPVAKFKTTSVGTYVSGDRLRITPGAGKTINTIHSANLGRTA